MDHDVNGDVDGKWDGKLEQVGEHLLEYQDYVLAYRLRTLAGERTRPVSALLSLPEYARTRLLRQALAKEVLSGADYRDRLRRVEVLTEALNFGFWHNPGESVAFLRKATQQGGCRALESTEDFIWALMTPRERGVMSEVEARLVATYYLGLLRASATYLDAEVFTRLCGELEPLRERLPFFILPETTPA